MAIIRNSISSSDCSQDLSKHLSEWLNAMHVKDLFRTCVTCLNLKEDRFCSVYNANPPASVIIVGCDSYKDNEEIPF